jgi:hypothetical protein
LLSEGKIHGASILETKKPAAAGFAKRRRPQGLDSAIRMLQGA